jgi:hypothetical protein
LQGLEVVQRLGVALVPPVAPAGLDPVAWLQLRLKVIGPEFGGNVTVDVHRPVAEPPTGQLIAGVEEFPEPSTTVSVSDAWGDDPLQAMPLANAIAALSRTVHALDPESKYPSEHVTGESVTS